MTKTIQKSVAVKPIAPYLGGKSKLAKHIINRIEQIPHKSYAEPFVGMGGVFLRRPVKSKAEFINDYNNEVANLFRIIQRHEQAFLNCIKYMISTRRLFKLFWDVPPHTLTDIDRAVRFFYLQRLGFGGHVNSKCYGVSKERSSRFNTVNVKADIEALATRLSAVTIENLDFQEFIERYDTKVTMFYLDPPYWNCEKDYGKDLFSKADFKRLAKTLRGIKGKFLLSLNDTPEIMDIFKAFDFEAVQTTYSISKDKNTPANEVIISN